LVVNFLHLEPGIRWSARLRKELVRALEAFAGRLGARDYTVLRTEPERVAP
jgi:hypothetical protein